MSFTKYKAVLFDLDGTLIDSAPDMVASLNQILKEEGLAQLTLDTLRPYVSKGGLAMTKVAFDKYKNEDDIEPLRLRFLDYYLHNIADHSKLFDGFESLLEALEQRSIAWGVVTNKPGWLTDPLMAALKLDKRSAVTISGDTTAEKKPHPLPLLTAAEAINISCEHCLYIGDDPRDIEAGNAANMTTVIAKYGYISDNSNLKSWMANSMIDHPAQILDLI
ncbi:MAG: phosphoglycolate phosphatase [Gammaproteobacteria bacterium]|jgi:phosphoglycolate phosphatase|nr:phosphoglycolate phosphatase [Gammaproteobacteria bacterium]MBT3723888.1 phosphoglycolate phosphatase [Gammaproteobacteria bacterium]MBT4076720.1 phosphoglycolate phosphatase [Gammaproteobacteria bacterium]MBT4450809.1 phosphoglycolate phosphatase [Gammaproteobacteria bacterium]MBT4861861.1 phosphoglycolate phosphatase [Gammaproteobacteria bacterium]